MDSRVGFPSTQNVFFRRTNMNQIYNVILVIFWYLLIADGNVVRNEDICGVHNGRRLYLELGEKGILYAKNVSFIKNAPRQDTSRVYATNSSHDQCSLELVTCPSCVIIVTFKSLALSHHCGDGGVMMDTPCRCDYVWISEPPYEDVSGTPFCGLYAPITYRSSTRTLSIALLYSQSHKHAFTLEYTAERNRLHLKGTEITRGATKGLNNTGGGILTSPFFPARYPRDLGLEYIITCPTDAPSCRIRLLFSDFQLATVSIMEFYDWNGQRLDVSSGARFRPPVIVSSGPSLLIRFYANGGTGLGYKAFYSFVIGHLFDKSVQPITDCGGYVENLGGAITMMDMVGQGVKTYDCVWLIRPPKNFLHMRTHMYLKVIAFADMAGNTELTIRQGPTSALLPLEIIRHPVSQLQPPRHREHIAPVTSGFHVSLRGIFGPTSHLAIAYAAFSYMDCFTGSDFLCQNHRCIPNQLNCDGFDHCGDNSDEPTSCFQDWELEPQDRKWHSNKANYYFPKIDRYPDLKTATLVFVASSLGLIILISALIILLYRMGARARQQRELQSRLQTISELLDGARIDEISVADDPPVYEAPPGYDEVVKLSLEAEGVRRKKRRSASREPRSRSSPSHCSYDPVAQSSSSCLVTEGASTSRSSQTTPIPSQMSKQMRVPESPPPPYITPPGTISRNMNIPALSSSDTGDMMRIGRQGVRARRAWLRRSNEFSRSVPASDQPPIGCPSSSIDAEVLGAYLRDYVAANSTCTAESNVPQLSAQVGSSSEASQHCPQSDQLNAENPVEALTNAEAVVDNPAEAANNACQEAEAVGDQTIEPDTQAESVGPEPRWNAQDRNQTNDADLGRTGCCCEGACGCANDNISLTVTANSVQDEEIPTTSGSSGERQESEDVNSSKSSIIRLLSTGSRVSRSGMTNASAGNSTSSTPCGTLGRNFRKFSVCSRDSYATKISNISSCNSYEKLQDEFEIVSEAASVVGLPTNPSTVTNTPAGTPRISGRHRCQPRRHSSCDMDNLYEGIKALDNYMARRGLTVAHPKKQTPAVMLFGTPEHTAHRREEDRSERRTRSRSRIWRSSDDALSN